MPRKLPPHCERFHDRHGKLRVYFRRGKGARVALPPEIGSPEFDAAYKAALLGETPVKAAGGRRAQPGTIGALIASYLSSAKYAGLRATTKTGYRRRLEILRTKHGHRTLAGMTRAGIQSKILDPYNDRPGEALSILKLLRILIRHAIEMDWLTRDPSFGIKRPKTNEIYTWTEEEIAQFERRWPIGTKQRLAFALMLYTGQRRSDAHRMRWSDIGGDSIGVVQQKTRAKLTIRLHANLREILQAHDRSQGPILATEAGPAFTVDGFSQFMRAAITAANLPLECQPHGLRKAAGRRLAEAGCTAHMIMAVLGHKTLAEAERYTRAADQARLAATAIERTEAHARINNSQTASREFGAISTKANNFNIEGLEMARPRGATNAIRDKGLTKKVREKAPVEKQRLSKSHPKPSQRKDDGSDGSHD
jgi:integrase